MTDFEYLWQEPVHPPQVRFPEFGYKRERIAEGVLFERDVALPMRDGARLYADVYRPASGAPVPAIVTWAPYGKQSGEQYERFFKNGGVDPAWVSKYAVYEGPDPLSWVPRGYAIVNVDSRGMYYSEGQATFLNKAEGLDGYDAIEFLAGREWCSGKVGMTGVSYLAIAQWQIAATRPPHLAAINVWEGVSDMYREFLLHGGIPESNFVPRWSASRLTRSFRPTEDLVAMTKAHPLWDAYWESKRAALSQIVTPAYIVASWSDHGLHTRGTLQGYREIASEHKWLEIHGRKKWAYFLQPDEVDKQRRFFDHFLRGVTSDVLDWPKVWLEVRKSFYIGDFRAEDAWPIARTEHRKLYLDAVAGTLGDEEHLAEARVAYEAPAPGTRTPAAYGEHRAQFDYRFRAPADLVGYTKLRLWVEAEGNDDMDLFVALQKLDVHGKHVGFPVFNAFEDGPVAMGWLRVSHRELDEARSRPEQPWLLHRRLLKLKPGDIVPVEIEIWPSGTHFDAGETLRVVVQGSDVYTYGAGGYLHPHTLNRGRHIIHTGGAYDSHLLVPLLTQDFSDASLTFSQASAL